MPDNPEKPQSQTLPLDEAVTHLLEECRMVLPGIQALFGFQLIAVFNESFTAKLLKADQYFHFAAIALVAVAVALVMAPAAYHRVTGPRQVSQRFVRIASGFLLAGMFPLALGICIDVYVVSRILKNVTVGIIVACTLFAIYMTLWLIFPRLLRGREQREKH